MVASSPTSSLNGRAATASPSYSISRAPPAARTPTPQTSPRTHAYRSTPSNSVGRSLVALPDPACSLLLSHSETQAGTGTDRMGYGWQPSDNRRVPVLASL